eukprot:g10545.t1
MSPRLKRRTVEDRGDGNIIGRPEQATKAPAFSVPRETCAPLPPVEHPTAFWRVREQQHVRETRSGSPPPQPGCRIPQTTLVRRSYRDASGGGGGATSGAYCGGGVAYADHAAGPPSDGGLITPRAGSAPTTLDSGDFTPPVNESLRLDGGGGLNAVPRGEDGGLVAMTGGSRAGQEEEEDGEMHGREVGFKVAGLYVARAAASPNTLPLPPLYHMLEVAHRQQRQELEERFAAKEIKMKEEQDRLRNQLRLLEATAPKAGNIYEPRPVRLARSRNAAGIRDADTQRANSEGTSGTKTKDGGGVGEGTTAVDTVVTADKSDGSAVSKAAENIRNTDHRTVGIGTKNGSSTNDTSVVRLNSNNSGSTSSGSTSATQPTSAADRIKAAREAVSVSLQELIASGEKLGRMREEADQARRRVRSMISGPPSDDRVAAAMMTRRSSVGFLQASSAGWLKLSPEAKMRILSEIERELGLQQLGLSKRSLPLPGPTKDDQIGSGDGDGGVGSVDGDGGDVAVATSRGEVEPVLRERLVTPVAAAGVAGKEEGGLKAELEAVKDRLRVAEEQMSKYKALETNAALRAAKAEWSADRLTVQLEARKRQIEELREISQGNLIRAQLRREAIGDLGGEEAGV